MAFNSRIQTYQILTNNDEVCIPSLSTILIAVTETKSSMTILRISQFYYTCTWNKNNSFPPQWMTDHVLLDFFFIYKTMYFLSKHGFYWIAKEMLWNWAHWTYWLQILSKLCFQRVALSGNYEILAICTDKNTFFNVLDY